MTCWCVHDLEGRFLWVNPVPARLLGYRLKEMMRMPMRDFVDPQFRDQFDAYLREIEHTGFRTLLDQSNDTVRKLQLAMCLASSSRGMQSHGDDRRARASTHCWKRPLDVLDQRTRKWVDKQKSSKRLFWES
jgi:hypothetical protein